VLEVVQKELKERVIESSTVLEPSNGNTSKDSYGYKDWVHFNDSENFLHPNLFAKGNVASDDRGRKPHFIN
jgi:hypothetical protein